MVLQRYDFKLDNRPGGIALNNAFEGDTVQVQARGFFTSDDGPHLYDFLDSFYAGVIAPGVPLRPESMHSVFVSVTDGTNVTAIVNPDVELSVLPTVTLDSPGPVYYNQIADITEARLVGYELPTRGAIAYLFQDRWRRGFYFDFQSHHSVLNAELGDLRPLLGSLHAALMLRERMRMEPAVLRKMAKAGWFPFTRLSGHFDVELYRHFENDWDPAKPIAAIVDQFSGKVGTIVESWAIKPAFAPHLEILREGARLFADGKYVGAASTILPKVEGVLRHIYSGVQSNPNLPELRKHLVGRVRAGVEGYTALLPEAFIEYLETYFHARFDLKSGIVPASRHAFLHGVGPDNVLADPSYCLRLFLILDQVFFCVSRMKETVP